MNRSLQKRLMHVIVLFILIITVVPTWGQGTPDANGILYVKKGAAGNGSSWTEALGEAADALKTAATLTTGTVTQIWVAGGTYHPLYRADNLDGANPVDRNNSFVLIDNVKIYGGFAGTETELSQRDLTLIENSSILSGDYNGNDVVTGTGATLAITANTENASHIVISIGTVANPVTAATVLDGFTITGGNAFGTSSTVNGVSIITNGGGMFIQNASPSFSNLIIKGNSSNNLGGGIYSSYSSSSTLTNSMVSRNVAKGGVNSRGGGICNMISSTLILANVLINGNRSYGLGGGIHNDNSSPILTNVTIVGNWGAVGGGVYNNTNLSNPKFRNTIIYGNGASLGANLSNNNGAVSTITYSLIQQTTTDDANGNLDGATDPLFIDATTENYMLQPGSPVIDTGNNNYFVLGSIPDLSGITTDLIGSERIYDGTIDLGAYELNCATPNAPTATAQAFCVTAMVADLTAVLIDGAIANWYAAADATEVLVGDTALTTQTYYVSQAIGVCESPRTPVAVTINGLPEAPIAEAQTFCGTTTVAALVPAPSASIQWYASADATNVLTDNTVLITQTYFVSQKTGGCESPRTPVIVVANTPDPTAVSQTYCEGATVANLQVTIIDGAFVQWYAGGTFGEVLENSYPLTTGSYYVSQTIDGCESERIQVMVTITPQVLPDFAAIAPICIDSPAPALALVSPNGIVGTWNPSEILTTQIGILEYVFTPTEGIAACTASQTLSVTVNDLTPAPTGEETQDFTNGETLADFNVIGENIIWYDAPTGGNVLSATDLIVAQGIYYASQTLASGCGESIERLKIIAGINLATVTFNTNNFKFYPNPVTDILTIDSPETIDLVEVFNLLGQRIYDKKASGNTFRLNFSDLASGSYLVKVVSGQTSKVFNVIKK